RNHPLQLAPVHLPMKIQNARNPAHIPSLTWHGRPAHDSKRLIPQATFTTSASAFFANRLRYSPIVKHSNRAFASSNNPSSAPYIDSILRPSVYVGLPPGISSEE